MLKNKKSLGQNWLKDRDMLLAIAELAKTDGVDTVLEIGPGLGTLTSALFKYFDQVIAVELDAELAAKLPKSFPGKNLTVKNQDILALDLSQLNLPENYVVAGNIPYYITSPIIQKFLHANQKPQRIVFLVQKEVAERLAGAPGNYSVLGLTAQSYAKVVLGPVVKRDLFTPAPKVDSQVVVFTPLAQPLAYEATLSLIKLGFIAPRKKLISNLTTSLQLPKEELLGIFANLGIPEMARPADLTIADWGKLENKIHKR